MHPASQIIHKNLHRQQPCDAALWINPEKDSSWREAASGCDSLALFCQDHGSFQFHKQSGANVEFGAFPAISRQAYRWIILNLPRQKALLRMMLECAAGSLAEDGTLWLAGENKAGIKSADNILKTFFGQVRKVDNARHCTLYEARAPLQQNTFTPLSYQETWPLHCQESEISIVSYPGVFAHGRLDQGTALLLDAITQPDIDGEVLDFGCGAGVIGTCIAAWHPNARVTFLDSSALALKSCRETLTANGLNGTVLASDGLTEVDTSYDLIISNPPIHAGVTTDNRLSLRLLESAQEHIKPGGSMIIVANRHLPYEKWLFQSFRRVDELMSNDHYKIIRACP